jgi:anti-anti-sigma regulatory factor
MTPTNTTLFRVDASEPARSLVEAQAAAAAQEESSDLLLDFTGVHRIDSASVRALASVADAAAARSVRVTARAVSVEVYKVLKLAGVADRLAFM